MKTPLGTGACLKREVAVAFFAAIEFDENLSESEQK